jgi:hypothetical protein
VAISPEALNEKMILEQKTFRYLVEAESINQSIKNVEINAKKNKRLLGGY